MGPWHVLILEPACADRVGPLGPFAAVVVSVMLSPATGYGASKAARLPHPSSLLTWAWNKAFSPALLFILWGEAFQHLGAGQAPAGASWVGQTPELAGGCYTAHTGGSRFPAPGSSGLVSHCIPLSWHSQLLHLLCAPLFSSLPPT